MRKSTPAPNIQGNNVCLLVWRTCRLLAHQRLAAKPDGISMSAPKGAHYDNSANKATRFVEPRPDHRPKPPLKPKHIWALRTRLRHDGRVRDLAMFNIAIDSKLRGCDLVKVARVGHLPRRLRSAAQQRLSTEEWPTRAVRVNRSNPRGTRGLVSKARFAIKRLAVSEP